MMKKTLKTLFTVRGKCPFGLYEEEQVMTNKELQSIWYGAYSFLKTEDRWLQAFQYSKEQIHSDLSMISSVIPEISNDAKDLHNLQSLHL